MMISWGAAGIGKKVFGSAIGLALGVCELPAGVEPYINATSGTACVRARVSEDIVMAPESGQGAVKLVAATGDLGVHFSSMFAIQARGRIHGISRFDGTDEGWSLLPGGISKEPEHLVLRIGNPAFHPFRASVGDQRLPFGIDANPADDLWVVASDRFYWGKPSTSAVVTLDNMSETQLDFGVAGDRLFGGPDSSQRLSARLLYDLSFFERARLVVSAAEASGVRRYGMAFVTTPRSGGSTHLELVRSDAPDEKLDAGFRRLFRFAFEAPDRRWWILYDEDRLRTQTFAGGYRYFPYDGGTSIDQGLALRISVGRVRSLNAAIESRFMTAVGVEASL